MNRLRGIWAMQVAEANAKKLVEREEAQCVKAQRLEEQAAAKATKAMEKARHATQREENQWKAISIAENGESRGATNCCFKRRCAT